MGKVLRIREVGDPILGVKCQEVDLNNIDKDVLEEIEDLKANFETFKIYMRGHNLYDIFYGRFREQETELLKKYLVQQGLQRQIIIFGISNNFSYKVSSQAFLATSLNTLYFKCCTCVSNFFIIPSKNSLLLYFYPFSLSILLILLQVAF